MALKIDAKCEEKMTCAFKNDMTNLVVMCRWRMWQCDNEEWSRIWREIDLSVQNWYEEFDEFWLKHSKI